MILNGSLVSNRILEYLLKNSKTTRSTFAPPLIKTMMTAIESEFFRSVFDRQAQTRRRFRELLHSMSEVQRITILPGMNNHPLWNYGHALVTFYLLTYGRCNQELPIATEVLETYRKGSSPVAGNTDGALETLMAIDEQTEALFLSDYQNGKLHSYAFYETSFGIALHNLQDALQFNLLHESLHLGYAMAQRRILQANPH